MSFNRLLSSRIKYNLVVLAVLIISNIYLLGQKLSDVVDPGVIRKNILSKIKNEHQELPGKVIFYTESDSSFYGLPAEERIFPFQSGFGQTLLVWYYDTESFPRELLQDRFLWEITDQGYKEVGERGFGYFRDFALLAETVWQHDLAYDAVIAYRYSSVGRTVLDNSEEVRGRLEGYFQENTALVDGRSWQAESLLENRNINLLKDGVRESKWSSGVPYNPSQFITIDLKKEKKIARISIDTYNNKDQNNVGYKVMLPDDRRNWVPVFYANPYPPNREGVTDIYFKPLPARYIKIEQAGSHEFAPWVIHEISLYETLENK